MLIFICFVNFFGNWSIIMFINIFFHFQNVKCLLNLIIAKNRILIVLNFAKENSL
jgi:hypothetical protein